MSFIPKTRLEKILCGVTGAAANAKSRIEKAVAVAVQNAGNGGSGTTAPLEVTATVSTNAQSKQVLTLNKTALECYNAAIAGKALHCTGNMSGTTIDLIIAAEVFRGIGDDVPFYRVKARADPMGDVLFMSELVNGSDTVVLTETGAMDVNVTMTVTQGVISASTTASFAYAMAALAEGSMVRWIVTDGNNTTIINDVGYSDNAIWCERIGSIAGDPVYMMFTWTSSGIAVIATPLQTASG